ncbi:MAG: radical SAM protein [Candidatus Lambdaproteobacteria bacterium]|nr:radical SAM protein [Candidatus Lambdaproteobacteria bacterium]
MSDAAPYIVSWNLTRRCNLACAHCYLDAGTRRAAAQEEMGTDACRDVIDQICAINPHALLILTGGEPLLRYDLEEIADHAGGKGLWVVVGTNGTLLHRERAGQLKAAGVKGVGLSIGSLDRDRHDAFRGRPGAWAGAMEGLAAVADAGLELAVQVTVTPWNLAELASLADFAADRGARAINFYFLVCTGRGEEQVALSPAEAERSYALLYGLQRRHAGRMQVQAKCAPQYQRFIHRQGGASPHLHAFAGGCPAAVHYCRIGPGGDVTPCPYIPLSGGNLRQASLAQIWSQGEVFVRLRDRTRLGGRCSDCRYRALCSGCRARALADRGDLMAEDPACALPAADAAGAVIAVAATALYGSGEAGGAVIAWEPEALESLERIPPFVRGMVRRRLERFAAERGAATVTRAMMVEIRDRMTGAAPRDR